MLRPTIVINFSEERALFRIFAFVASVAIAGLGLASQPASAASFGQFQQQFKLAPIP
jgi:hypothetical protein